MAGALQGRTVAFVATDGVEQVELTEPWHAIEEAGGTPRLVSMQDGKIQGFNHLDAADTFAVDETVEQAQTATYDGLVLPGGVANPDALRGDEATVSFIRSFFEAGKPVAVICHGPWTLIEASVVKGRQMTSWPSLQTDLRNAGADWVDEQVVVNSDGPNILISSRNPDDLPAFCSAIIEHF